MRRSLRSWLWRVPLDQEVDDEIELHIDLKVRELVAQGMERRSLHEGSALAGLARVHGRAVKAQRVETIGERMSRIEGERHGERGFDGRRQDSRQQRL